VSVVATKNIIDAVKGVWLSATKDLEEAKTNIEVFVNEVHKKCVSPIFSLET